MTKHRVFIIVTIIVVSVIIETVLSPLSMKKPIEATKSSPTSQQKHLYVEDLSQQRPHIEDLTSNEVLSNRV